MSKRIVIAGGGIIGASIAWRLARANGAAVTLLEKSEPAAGTTRDSFAWINATYSKQPREYFNLNLAGVAAWRRLEREMKAPPPIQWGGSVAWEAGGSELEEEVERHRNWGYSTRLIDEAELRRLVPALQPGRVGTAAFSDEEGTLDPVAATQVLVTEARQAGAAVHYPCEVTGLVVEGGRVQGVMTTTQGVIPVDVLVVACGNGTPRVAAMAGVQVPLKDSPGMLAHTTPQARLIDRLALGPGSHIKQDSSGRIVAGDNFAGGALPGTGEDLLRNAARYLPSMDTALDRVSLGWRVMPQDEFPIIGFTDACPNLYIVATHSGVTLAALFGEYAAAEILDGVRVEELKPYRLSRFAD
jgi:glycine/D-amino acid oxidase-like deaminating enzyme